MDLSSLGGGLAALGFWLFVAAMVVGGMWYDLRKRESQQETLRRLIESGQPVEEGLAARLLGTEGADSRQLARDLRVGGLITLAVSPGLLVLGIGLAWAVQQGRLVVILGAVALLVAFIAGGLLAAASMVERRYGNDRASDPSEGF